MTENEQVMITDDSRLFTGAEFLCHALDSVGVTHVFGGHGGAVVPLIDAIVAHPKLTWVYAKCEVNASQMAAAYAKLNGRPGCCVATSGPGAAHLLSGLVDADQDRVPVVCITGMKPTSSMRHSDFQDIDQSAIFRMASLGLSETVSSIDQLLPIARNAFTLSVAQNRVTHLAVPIDVQMDEVTARPDFCLGRAFEARRVTPASDLEIEALSRALRAEIDSDRHVLVACGYRAHSVGKYVEQIAELLHAPILTSYDGKGSVDEHHPLAFGVVGVYGNAGTSGAVDLLDKCDTVIGICVNEWTELVSNKSGLQLRRIIQIDDSLVAGDSLRFDPVSVFSCGHLGEALGRVAKSLEGYFEADVKRKTRLTTRRTLMRNASTRKMTHEPRSGDDIWAEIKKESFAKPTGTPSTYLKSEFIATSPTIASLEHCHPGVFFDVMGETLDDDSIMCADIGDNALFMASSLAARRGQRFLTSEHLGIMGYSINSGIAAAMSTGPETKKLVVAGDGGVQMSINELSTMKDLGAKNVLVVVIVNSRLGRVKNEKWGAGLKADGCFIGSPDYVKLFEAYGYPGGMVLSTSDRESIATSIEKGWESAATHGCCVIELHQDPSVAPVMHKLAVRKSLFTKSTANATKDSLHPPLKVEHDNRMQIQEWLNSLTKVEKSEEYWLNKGDFFTMSPSAMVEKMYKSYEIAPGAQFFGSEDAKKTFDTEFKAAALESLPAKVLLEEIIAKGTSNTHPMKMQFLACPPNFNFSLHSHPTVELIIPAFGAIYERRLMGARVDPSLQTKSVELMPSIADHHFYSHPLPEEMDMEDKAMQEKMKKIVSLGTSGCFVDRKAPEGSVMFNDVGSVHQTYSDGDGCLILVVWGGIHADLVHCDCCGIKGNEMLFMPVP